MKNFFLVYHAGFDPIWPDDFRERQKDWDDWFEEMGDAVLDRGSILMENCLVQRDGEVADHGGKNPAIGHSMIKAEDKDAAIELVKKCPLIEEGGDIQIAEILAA